MEEEKKNCWGGRRPGQGRPKKEVKNAKRQISVPPELDALIQRKADEEGTSYSAMAVRIMMEGLKNSV